MSARTHKVHVLQDVTVFRKQFKAGKDYFLPEAAAQELVNKGWATSDQIQVTAQAAEPPKGCGCRGNQNASIR